MANEGLLIVFEQCAHDALDSSGLELNAGPIFAKRAVGAGAFGDRHYLKRNSEANPPATHSKKMTIKAKNAHCASLGSDSSILATSGYE
jgi:hypothetical protein